MWVQPSETRQWVTLHLVAHTETQKRASEKRPMRAGSLLNQYDAPSRTRRFIHSVKWGVTQSLPNAILWLNIKGQQTWRVAAATYPTICCGTHDRSRSPTVAPAVVPPPTPSSADRRNPNTSHGFGGEERDDTSSDGALAERRSSTTCMPGGSSPRWIVAATCLDQFRIVFGAMEQIHGKVSSKSSHACIYRVAEQIGSPQDSSSISHKQYQILRST